MIAVFGFLVYNTSAELKDLEVNHATDILTYAKMSKADRELSLTPEPIETAVRVWHWLRLLLSSFGLIGTLLYFIKWQNKWADRHAESEFELQQFQLDVNRASWVIESCLEWRKETSNHVPAELLKSITHNLFSRGNAEVENVVHPADALASALMGSASKVKLKMGDSDVEFDKPGKIAKSVAAKDD